MTQDANNGLMYNSWIKCRISTDYNRLAHQAEVIVTASTFEEAQNKDGFNQKFQFLDETRIPTVTDISPVWTGTKWNLVITGTDITDTDPN